MKKLKPISYQQIDLNHFMHYRLDNSTNLLKVGIFLLEVLCEHISNCSDYSAEKSQ